MVAEIKLNKLDKYFQIDGFLPLHRKEGVNILPLAKGNHTIKLKG